MEKSKTKGKTSPVLTDAEWANVAAKYETGEYTIAQLAGEIGCAESTVQKKMRKMGAKKGAMAQKFRERAATDVMDEIYGSKDKHVEQVSEARDWFEKNQKVIDGVHARANKSVIDEDYIKAQVQLKTVVMLQDVTYRSKNAKWEYLGLNTIEETDDIEGFTVEDLTDDDIHQITVEQLASERMMQVGSNSIDDYDDELVQE